MVAALIYVVAQSTLSFTVEGRRQAVDHLLLAGPPGVGKTTLAGIVAAELEVGFRVTSGPALERSKIRVPENGWMRSAI